jgi:hypothetical protein
MRTQRILSIVIAALCASTLLYIILQAGVFNFIPYMIHKEFFSSYNSSGESTAVIGESSFIMFFDVIISVLFFGIMYKFLFWLMTKGQHE